MDLRGILLEQTFKASFEREIEGTLGRILIFCNSSRTLPERFAVKTVMPHRVPSKTTYESLQRFCHELRHWIRYRHHPLILTPFYTAFVQEWPYVAMPYCESNVRDFIASNVPTENKSEAIAIVVQILEALCYAREKGLRAHQDLKPENVLLQNLRDRFNLTEEYPFAWRVRVADFGLANAYAELGIRWGSRPYLAPEQYESEKDLLSCDVFACGVIFHELLTGRHPIGVVTSQVWPETVPGQPTKWRHEEIWKQWARKVNKLTPELRKSLGLFGELIESSLAVEPWLRPDLPEFKAQLLNHLQMHDRNAYDNLAVLLKHYNSTCIESETSGDTDERYQEKNLNFFTRQHLH